MTDTSSPQTPDIEQSVIINAPVERVFEFITNPKNRPKFLPDSLPPTNISSKAAKVGQTWDWHNGVMKMSLKGKAEVVGLEPLRRYTVKHSGDADVVQSFLFEAAGDKTKLTYSAPFAVGHHSLEKLNASILHGIHQIFARRALENVQKFFEQS
ncbi:hypothetical protein A2841_00045 [Candidatus Kaiserbacteria bacterium RIFCSPHIGHO2_01_FULL_48_10]|uniref:Polyketide cyclase n=1 Tax=Candidatus Kaiserbacteria bacterium RIFCSPHIGHO2_01_FULL_48_10 TaxID=1798476 RepID=A0A1F6C5M3_9BACT|nr:MAG: hypothetical protein A2841_00045 [Candidatus Kaiserbacteria bacterium RIFCSPHIGHO2_01_FULL_48_10]HLC99545.1 SRPBCC family protein [Patescibacteria group bacterium]